MTDMVNVMVSLPADRMKAFQRIVPSRWGGRVISVSAPDGLPPLSAAQARRRMVQEATPLQLRVIDALHGLPRHEGTRAAIAMAAAVNERTFEGVLGSLGAKLNSRMPGQRRRAVHLWLEETTTIDGEKLYRLRPEFITDCGRWHA
jgi:hypothetical protein